MSILDGTTPDGPDDTPVYAGKWVRLEDVERIIAENSEEIKPDYQKNYVVWRCNPRIFKSTIQSLSISLATRPAPATQGVSGWISVKDKLPKSRKKVLVFFINSCNHSCITLAEHVGDKEVLGEDFLDESSDGFSEYDEEKDCYWTPAGWYEQTYQPEMNYFLNEKITHWMNLPEKPEMTAAIAEAEKRENDKTM